MAFSLWTRERVPLLTPNPLSNKIRRRKRMDRAKAIHQMKENYYAQR